MFASNGYTLNLAQENKDALTARKPGTTAVGRKPLADRAVNPSENKQSRAKRTVVVATCVDAKYPEWYSDVSSFKDVEDTYEDILPKSRRLTTSDFLNSLRPPKTPPLVFDDFLPMVMEVPRKPAFAAFSELKQVDVVAPPIPDFD